MALRPFWIFALALSPLACGSVVTTTGGTSGTGAGGGTSATLCPAAEPNGGECSAPTGFHCTYGEQVRPECRHEWTCGDGGTWITTKGVCLSPPADHCQFTEPPSGVCGQEGDVCVVGAATICQCSACFGGPCMAPPPVWQCSGPPATSGCPMVVPNDGSACTSEGLECTYGNVCSASGALARCMSGLWVWDRNIACAD